MWLLAAAVLLLGVIPCLVVCVRDEPVDGLVALETASIVVTEALLMLSVGFARSTYADAAVVLAALSFAGGMAFVRTLGRST